MYKYKNPINNGYKRFYLSKKAHNKLFPKRKINMFKKNEYYILEDKQIIIYSFLTLFGKLLTTIILPIAILINLSDIKDTIYDYKRSLFQKKYGTFTSDIIISKEKIKQVMSLAKK